MRKIVKKDLGILGLYVATFAVLQALISLNFIDPFWELNIILIGINIILAAGLNLINGYTGQFSLGHAGFMAVGAYVSAIVTMKLGLPFIVAIMAGACAAGLLGLLIGLPTLRLSGDYLAIATLGLGEIIRITILNINYIGGASGFMGIPRYTNFAWVFFFVYLFYFSLRTLSIRRTVVLVFPLEKMKWQLKRWVLILLNIKC